MSKYFEPIDIRPKVESKPEPVNEDLIADVSKAIEAVDVIMSELVSGTSNLREGGIHFPEGKSSPVHETLKRLRANPTSKKFLRQFMTAALGDLGLRVARAMADHFQFADPKIGEVFIEPK